MCQNSGFKTKKIAERVAARVGTKARGVDGYVYRCRACKLWHVGNSMRRTSKDVKGVNLQMSYVCKSKKLAYATRLAAKKTAVTAGKNLGKQLYPYKCDFCGAWHLTSAERKGKEVRLDTSAANVYVPVSDASTEYFARALCFALGFRAL